MSRVDDLTAESCPDGVPYWRLGDAMKVIPTARGIKKSAYGDGTQIAIVDQGQELVAGYTDEDHLALENCEYVVFGDHTRAIKWVDFKFAVGADGTKVLKAKPNLLPKFAYYAMTNLQIPNRGYNRHWTLVREMTIPIPPLAVQKEVVSTLDTFKQLEAELDAEVTARRRQRAALACNFAVSSRSHAWETVALGTIARPSIDPVKLDPDEEYVSLGVKWYGEGVLAREPRIGREIKAATLFRARAGQFIYNRMFVVEGSFAIVSDACDWAVVSSEFPLYDLDTSRVDPYWLLQYFRDEYTLRRIEAEVTGVERGTMKSRRRWKQDQFAEFRILLPPLEVQQESTRVLRLSDDLIASLEDELRVRRQQLSYYRDRLLTFEEPAA